MNRPTSNGKKRIIKEIISSQNSKTQKNFKYDYLYHPIPLNSVLTGGVPPPPPPVSAVEAEAQRQALIAQQQKAVTGLNSVLQRPELSEKHFSELAAAIEQADKVGVDVVEAKAWLKKLQEQKKMEDDAANNDAAATDAATAAAALAQKDAAEKEKLRQEQAAAAALEAARQQQAAIQAQKVRKLKILWICCRLSSSCLCDHLNVILI